MNLSTFDKAILIAVGIATAIVLTIINRKKTPLLTVLSVVCVFVPVIVAIFTR